MKRKPIQVDWKKNTLKTFVEALHKIFIYVFFFLRECNFWYSTMTCFESFCDFTQCIWNLDVSSVKWKTDWWPLCSLQAWIVFCLAICCLSFYINWDEVVLLNLCDVLPIFVNDSSVFGGVHGHSNCRDDAPEKHAW